MKHILDARGLTCPLPVINTKKELEGVNIGENIEVIVDNEIAVQNLTKFANVQGFPVSSSKVSDDEFHVNISKGEKIKLVIEEKPHLECGVMVLKGKNQELLEKINKGLKELEKNGTYRKIMDKYLVGYNESL